MSRIVEIRPNPNFSGIVTGNLQISGEFLDKKGNVILSAIGRDALKIDSSGLMLFPDKEPIHAKILQCVKECSNFKAMIDYPTDGVVSANHRFYIHDQEAHDEIAYEEQKEDNALISEILSMDDKKVVLFAKLFGIKGDSKSCKVRLIQFVNDKKRSKEIAKMLNNPNRLMKEVIAANLEKGNQFEKDGLYVENGYYFYNGNSIGFGEESVIEWLKEESDVYIHLKENVYGKEAKVKEPKK